MAGISSTLNKAIRIGIQFSTLQLANQVVSSQPNIPPLVKTLIGFSTDFAGYEIINSALDILPPNMRSLGKTLNKAQASILALQQLPNLIAAIQSAGASGGFLSTAPMGIALGQ